MSKCNSDPHAFRAIGIGLPARMVTVWRQGKLKIGRLFGAMPSQGRATYEPTWRLPHEITEMVIVHLGRDLPTLKVFSLVCRSWYTTAVPHLHHTLTLRRERPGFARIGEPYPQSTRDHLKPLPKLHELGLIPLVRKIRVDQRPGTSSWFVPQAFSPLNLRYFSAFVNVHTLDLENMQIHRFVPDIKCYFGHFSPTLRSIKLSNTYGTPRQLSYFLSLFPNLDDIKIWTTHQCPLDTTIPDTELVPLSIPKLRGRLVLSNSDWVETWTCLTTSRGGPRFRYMDLRGSASCAPVLFEACAETLETLRFNVTDDKLSEQLHIGLSTDSS